jgi:hypothetical protein
MRGAKEGSRTTKADLARSLLQDDGQLLTPVLFSAAPPSIPAYDAGSRGVTLKGADVKWPISGDGTTPVGRRARVMARFR